VTGVPYWVLALALVIVIVAVLAALERHRPWRRELGGDVDGDLGGRPSSPSADRAPRLAPDGHAPQRA
jgi:hypothetical protein